MKQNTVLIGFGYGIMMASDPDVSSYYLLFVFAILITMSCIQEWSHKKIAERRWLLGLINVVIFIIVSGAATTLYVDFLSEPFLETIFYSCIFSIFCIYYPISIQIEPEYKITHYRSSQMT